MTEAEWLACADPEAQIDFLWGKDDRKMRLFAVACCHRIWHLIPDPLGSTCVRTAEAFADGQVTASALHELHDSAYAAHEQAMRSAGHTPALTIWAMAAAIDSVEPNPNFKADGISRATQTAAGCAAEVAAASEDEATACRKRGWQIEEVAQANLLREIYGNPFRLVTFDTAWRTANVTNLAETIYAERAFDRMPILADALEEAGCDNRDILDHCRGPGPHVRGCWVVDLVLGKE